MTRVSILKFFVIWKYLKFLIYCSFAVLAAGCGVTMQTALKKVAPGVSLHDSKKEGVVSLDVRKSAAIFKGSAGKDKTLLM